tara:strand:+ start:406 stop:540 length:135 start_codon:yes stop_codon:yes gene_type:complete
LASNSNAQKRYLGLFVIKYLLIKRCLEKQLGEFSVSGKKPKLSP